MNDCIYTLILMAVCLSSSETMIHPSLRRWEHVLDLLIRNHDILYRILSALEVIEVEIGVTGQKHLYRTSASIPESRLTAGLCEA